MSRLCRPASPTAALVLFSLALSCAQPTAHAHPPGSSSYTLDVQDEYGASLRTFAHDGQLFVLGERGQRYAIVVQNQTPNRVEAVVTVDGRDVVSGKLGDFVNGRGYVLGPYASLRIEGFRKSLDEIAAFRFSSPSASYSARVGTPEHVGVIGAAFFPEQRRIPRPRPLSRLAEPEAKSGSAPRPSPAAPARNETSDGERRAAAPAAESAASFGAGASADRRDNLGTEYGETHRSQVEEVRFVRALPNQPGHVAVLRYDDRAGLAARGIELEPHRYSYREPQPFPRSDRFAAPPP